MTSCWGAYVCSILFGVVDFLQGSSVLIFYGYQQYIHRYCTYAHGVLFCEYFNFKSNHNLRTKIGLGEGLVCMLVSLLLLFLVHKRKGILIWGWLMKPIAVVILNLYFVIGWMVQRGRYYHSYETPDEVYQEFLFIYFGAATAAAQIFLAIWFCCTGGVFTYQVRKRHRSQYSSCETKV